MARGAGAIIRREDWFLLAVMLVGAGVSLNQAAANGDRSPFGTGIRGLVDCATNPRECFRDWRERMTARAFWELGLLCIAATVVLRKFWPKFAGIPYGILIAFLAVMAYTGQLDGLLRSLDPRAIMQYLQQLLGGLGGGGGGNVIVIPQQPGTTPQTPPQQIPATVQRTCLGGTAICAGARGGFRRGFPFQGSHCPGGEVVECNDGSTWSRYVEQGRGPTPIAPARRRCLDPAALAAGRGGVKQLIAPPELDRCGWVECNNGMVIDLGDGSILARSVWLERARNGGFGPIVQILVRAWK